MIIEFEVPSQKAGVWGVLDRALRPVQNTPLPPFIEMIQFERLIAK